MATPVHVLITGIASVIPPGSSGAEHLVRLQDARGASHHAHFPSILTVRQKIEFATNPPPPDDSLVLTDGLEVAAWKIPANGDITVATPPLDGTLQTSLPYVLRIAKGCGGKPNCAKPNMGGARRHVDLRLTGGFLTTTNLTHQMWFFENESPPDPRWLAQELCWSFNIREPELKLVLPGLGTVTVKRLQNDEPIELRLQNTLGSDLIPSKPQQASEDEHVRLYFDLSSNAPGSRPALKALIPSPPAPPIHAGHQLDGDSIAQRNPRPSTQAIRINCPPALWDAP